jgi:integrase/recombinase XerC
MPNGPEGRGDSQVSRPKWLAAFLADGGTRKPSAHTLKAYCQDFDAITAINVGSDMDLSAILLSDIVAQRISGADI